jgi:chromosome segregation ATPase
MSDWKERAEWHATVEGLEEDRVRWQERALTAEAQLRISKELGRGWLDRAEAAEARAEANFQALQESEADLARTQARAEAAERRVRELEEQVVRAKMDFDGRPTNFAQAEVSLNTDIIKSLEVRAEAAEAALVKVQNDCDEWEADYARVVLLHVAERERANAAEAALADAKAHIGVLKIDLHKLSVKYTVALDQSREMREALHGLVRYSGDYAGSNGAVWEFARAVLASTQPDNA